MITKNMAKSNNSDIKKSRGRPATGQGTLLGVRLQPDQLAAIDAWTEKQRGEGMTRPEAIRRLIDLGLKAKTKG